VEKWKLTITKIDRQNEYLKFKLEGSKTGPDGTGDNKRKFVSDSGRIIIEPWDFFIFESEKITNKLTPVGFEVTWEIKPNFSDRIMFEKKNETYLVVQGLENKGHVLTLISGVQKTVFNKIFNCLPTSS